MHVHRFEPAYLPGLRALIDNHLSTVVPGWAMTDGAVAAHLNRHPGEPVTDPWVTKRATLLVSEGWAVLAAAHLLRYGDGNEVGEHFRGAGEIGWLLSVPGRTEPAAAVLSEARKRLGLWGVRREEVCSGGLPVPAFGGVPDRWPHVADALRAAGYEAGPGRREALYGGRLAGVAEPGDPPSPGLGVLRGVGKFGVRFSAVADDGEEIGHLECTPDLTAGGSMPALGGWAELAELWVREGSRDGGVGSWLVGHAARWLLLAGCDRVVVCVDENDEKAGAGASTDGAGGRCSPGWPGPGSPDERCRDAATASGGRILRVERPRPCRAFRAVVRR